MYLQYILMGHDVPAYIRVHLRSPVVACIYCIDAYSRKYYPVLFQYLFCNSVLQLVELGNRHGIGDFYVHRAYEQIGSVAVEQQVVGAVYLGE